jgi:hypothetical protein
MRRVVLTLMAAGCGRAGFDPVLSRGLDADVPIDADRCSADLVDLGPWGTPTNLGTVNDPTTLDDDPELSLDGLELYFTSTRSGSLGAADMWRARRASVSDPWGPVEHVDELSTTQNENTPALSSDALTMLFVSGRAGTMGGEDIWETTRPDRDSPWSAPRDVTELNSPGLERAPTLYLDELAIMFHSDRPGGAGGLDLWVASRVTVTSPWSTQCRWVRPTAISTSRGRG